MIAVWRLNRVKFRSGEFSFAGNREDDWVKRKSAFHVAKLDVSRSIEISCLDRVRASFPCTLYYGGYFPFPPVTRLLNAHHHRCRWYSEWPAGDEWKRARMRFVHDADRKNLIRRSITSVARSETETRAHICTQTVSSRTTGVGTVSVWIFMADKLCGFI